MIKIQVNLYQAANIMVTGDTNIVIAARVHMEIDLLPIAGTGIICTCDFVKIRCVTALVIY